MPEPEPPFIGPLRWHDQYLKDLDALHAALDAVADELMVGDTDTAQRIIIDHALNP